MIFMELQKIFIHHVFFWLKNPDNADDRLMLKEGLEKLLKIKSIRDAHIGRPADTDRGVIDRSYSLSWMLLFEHAEDQAAYQVDPIHLSFVETCSHLWNKVVVYDSVDV